MAILSKISGALIMYKQLQYAFIAFCVFGLTACGGGSGDDDSSSSSSSSSTSSSSSSSNSSSSSTNGALTAPQNVSAAPGNSSVSLDWSPVGGATSYHVFYATEPNIEPENIAAFENGTWVQNVTPPYEINELTNGETYYFVVTAVNQTAEGPQSNEVSTTPSEVDLAKQPTAQEVLVIEMINRARFDPEAEADRYEIDLNQGLNPGTISPVRKSPLAMNVLLVDSSRVHSQWMLDQDIFSHTGAGGNSMTDRMRNAGYSFSGATAAGENIAWSGNSSSVDPTEAAYGHHKGLFKSSGHRENILRVDYREIGVGQKLGIFTADGDNWNASMLTENFAKSGSDYFLTGVIYNDTNSDSFYNVGEGMSGITITVDGKSHAVFSTGAYSIPLSNDATYDVTISGAAIGTPVVRSVEINNANVKLDVIKQGQAINVSTW